MIFTWFLILDKIKDGNFLLRDVTHKLYLVLLRRAKGFPLKATEGKIASKYCNTSKTRGGVLSTHHVPGWGYDLPMRVRLRVDNEMIVMVIVLTAWKQNIKMGESHRLNALEIKLVYLYCFWIKYTETFCCNWIGDWLLNDKMTKSVFSGFS